MTFELIKNELSSLCDEMALTIARAAYSVIVRESQDLSTALLTPDGEVMAQGRTSALHLGSIMAALAGIRAKFGDEIEAGDIFINNDPYEGGSHLPDIFIIKPLFLDGAIAAFVGGEAHVGDIGGRVAGSNAADSTEIYQEGLRIPPTRLASKGVLSTTVLDLIKANVRQPREVIGDLNAILAALAVGERGYFRLVEKYGHRSLKSHIDEIMNYTEQVARAEIATWPDGEYTFEDAIDDDGIDPGPIPIRVRITVRGDELDIDFAGTAPQARAAINTPATFARAACYLAVRCALGISLPHNSGFTRGIHVQIPEGTVLNPRLPAAVSARALAAYRTANVVVGALAQIVPGMMMAGDEGGNTLITFAGTRPDGSPWVFSDIHLGTWGGRQTLDGIDGISSICVSTTNSPCEIVELEYPLLIQRYGYVADAYGAGRYRGGLALVREYRMLADRTMIQVRSDRMHAVPYGLFGGRPGTASRNVINPGPGQRDLPSKFTVWLNAGDVFSTQLPGAGGWGDPFDRDPAAVVDDVRNEKASPEFVAREHGVKVDGRTLHLDLDGTEALRAALAQDRGGSSRTPSA